MWAVLVHMDRMWGVRYKFRNRGFGAKGGASLEMGGTIPSPTMILSS